MENPGLLTWALIQEEGGLTFTERSIAERLFGFRLLFQGLPPPRLAPRPTVGRKPLALSSHFLSQG